MGYCTKRGESQFHRSEYHVKVREQEFCSLPNSFFYHPFVSNAVISHNEFVNQLCEVHLTTQL